jgi:outer membrane murein-binding lipoprotein Lpp
MEPTIWVAVIGSLTAAGSWFVGRRQRKADEQSITATAINAVQDTYQALINDLTAQVVAARQEATSARDAARDARRMAEDAENNSWLADMRARAMERFLVELRPLIAAHVPGADAILERLDKLTSPPVVSVIPDV